MRVLLVQPPFWAVDSPSIGLSYLRAALRDAGFDGDVLYSNLDFANRIGRELYEVIQAKLPVNLLFGDVVFGPALQGIPPRTDEALRQLLSGREGILDQYVPLAEQATRFIEDFQAARPWAGYDLVGFTTTFSLVPALAMAKALKAAPDAPPIVFGGCHCDGSLGEALMRHFPWIDFAARGDGERLVVALAEHLRSGQPPLRDIDGLLWREGDRVLEAGKSRARAADMDALPEPAYHDWLGQLKVFGWDKPQGLRLPIETSRGCWYGQKHPCAFCGLNGPSMEFRSKGTDRILAEYSALLEYDIPVFYAVDSVLDPSYFRDVIPRLEALPRKANMFFEVRATHSRAQLLALRNAGIRVLQPGIESLDSRLLRLMNKGTTAFQNVRLLKWAAELSIPVSWNMLCGLPGEEPEDYARMVDLVPSLVHLLPPITACNPIHVDRFSPLFERHREDIEPIAPYAIALGLDAEAVCELAYHFTFTDQHPGRPETIEAIQQLGSAILKWQSAIGSAAFVKLEREGKCWLYDTRPGATCAEACLEGYQAQAYSLMEAGCTRRDLEVALGIAVSALEPMLRGFTKRHWIVELNGKYLSLAVPLEEDVPCAIPEKLQGSVATALYQHRMAQLWRIVSF